MRFVLESNVIPIVLILFLLICIETYEWFAGNDLLKMTKLS